MGKKGLCLLNLMLPSSLRWGPGGREGGENGGATRRKSLHTPDSCPLDEAPGRLSDQGVQVWGTGETEPIIGAPDSAS